MSLRIMLSVFALAATAMTANAADLPTRSRLGAIFAEPGEVRVDAYQSVEYPAPIIGFNLLPDPPWARGGYYYGSPWAHYLPRPQFRGAPHLRTGPPAPRVGPVRGLVFWGGSFPRLFSPPLAKSNVRGYR